MLGTVGHSDNVFIPQASCKATAHGKRSCVWETLHCFIQPCGVAVSQVATRIRAAHAPTQNDAQLV